MTRYSDHPFKELYNFIYQFIQNYHLYGIYKNIKVRPIKALVDFKKN